MFTVIVRKGAENPAGENIQRVTFDDAEMAFQHADMTLYQYSTFDYSIGQTQYVRVPGCLISTRLLPEHPSHEWSLYVEVWTTLPKRPYTSDL